ncbi:hypothetical protein BI347_12550 [Chromobacterium sphagni]|uniref:Uncharacterized protein n=1 Tax=Chromobacterium sphagni TaxID=1903179 RepID=A0A1S1X432_9NEIS|nr:hypothetical protein BI347_12550 [Chromobacterium sphagni]OHX16234.1 hypothetical protein BI344_12465 [Chromobacterium sphagni]
MPQRQRLLQLATACAVLLELDKLDGVEWARLPNGSHYRLDEHGNERLLLWRDAAGGRAQLPCRELALEQAAQWLLAQ